MSEAVERKLVALLGHPTTSPYGNPIPGLDKLGEGGKPAPSPEPGLVRVESLSGLVIPAIHPADPHPLRGRDASALLRNERATCS